MTARRAAGIAAIAGVIALAGALLYYPVLFLGLGVQAIGAGAGWWTGEPTSNDDEALIATVPGAIGCLVLLVAAGFAVHAIARRAGLPTRPAVAIGVGLLAVGALVFGVTAF